MKRILKITFTIILISFTSCEKSSDVIIEQVAKGTINATSVYTGAATNTWMRYSVCDINLLDVVSTMITQLNSAYMNGDIGSSTDIYNAFYTILQEQAVYQTSNGDTSFSRDMDPGTYILVARRRVQYSYSNSSTTAHEYQYKIIDVKSNETTYVVFVFEDHVSDAELIW